jgi:aldoxime dehydratase
VRHRNREGRLLDESSVVGTFLSLHALERWAESHTTHKAIYAEAFRQLRTYQERRELRTWHEVFVLRPEGQRFEYLNCHPQTGILSYFDASREG